MHVTGSALHILSLYQLLCTVTIGTPFRFKIRSTSPHKLTGKLVHMFTSQGLLIQIARDMLTVRTFQKMDFLNDGLEKNHFKMIPKRIISELNQILQHLFPDHNEVSINMKYKIHQMPGIGKNKVFIYICKHYKFVHDKGTGSSERTQCQ